ncbi:MAG: PAS domain S-box protein [Thermodesulfobacteriota bacterium]
MTDKPTYEELEKRVLELEQAESERKRALKTSQEREEHIRSLFEGIPVALFRTAEDGRIIKANPALAAMLGVPDSETLFSFNAAEFYVNPDDFLEQRRVLNAYGTLYGFEFQLRRRDGSIVWVSESTRTIRASDGQVYYEGSLNDISDRKKAEEEIRQSNSELAALNAIGAIVNQSLDLEIVLESSLKKTMSVLNAEGGLIYLFDETSGTFSPASHQGISTDMLRELTGFRWGEGLSGRVAETGEPLVTSLSEDVRNISLTSVQEGFRSYAGVPITSKNKMLGAMSLVTRRENSFKPQHLSLLGQIGNQVGVAIENAYLYEQAQRDIAERKQAEEALLDSEQKYRILVENANQAIFVVQDLKLVFFNLKTTELMGYPDEELRSKPFIEFIHPDDRKMVIDRHVRRLKGEELPHIYSFRILHKDGSIRWGELNAVLINWNGNSATLNFLSDITERKQTEDALVESEQRYRALYESTLNPIAIISTDGRYFDANPAFLKFVGKTKEQLLEMRAFDFAPSNKKESQQINHKKLWKSGGTIETAYLINGEEKLLELTITPFLYQNQKAILGTGRDITESTKLQSQLRQAQKMESIGTLAGGIAHDFNNILSIIVGNTELAMLDLPKWSPAQDNLKEVREATFRARELVKQILLFARQKEHAVSNIHLEPIVKESLKMLRASMLSMVEIRENIEEGLPPVLADPSQIQQIIMNLFTNAGQVMEEEGGTLTFTLDSAELETPLYTLSALLPPGRYLRMQVLDTGPGIPSENLERIFDPFFTTKGVGEGTGLGLAVVHGIVQNHKGGITVETEEGRGTVFTVYLPASEVESVEVTAEEKTELPRGTERVLFVDDEPMIMKLGQQMLERQGYEVETRASGTDALECFGQDPNRFDLVVTDMTMPGMRGDRLAEEILAIRPDIPVILCTGYNKQTSKEKSREIGIRALVMKPFTQHMLASTVRKVLDEKSQN